jgi:hypothetical protein
MTIGYHVFANTKTGEFIATAPPLELTDMPRGATDYPITKAQWMGLQQGVFTWDPDTREVVESVALIKAKNEEILKGRFRQAHLTNKAFLEVGAPAPPVLNQQIIELTKQINDLLRYLSGQTEEVD